MGIMKIIKQLLFIAIITICASFAALAQDRGDKQKRPPKDPPPVVVPQPKKGEKPKEDKPKNDENRPKKPQSMVFEVLQMTGIRFN